MRLVNAEMLLSIDIEENTPAILVIENPKTMSEVVEQLYRLCNSEEGDFVLSDVNKQLTIEKTVEIIVNPFSIEFNARKIQNKLYGELVEAESCYVEEKARIQAPIINYMDKIIYDIPYGMISYELEVDSMKLFKMLDVRIEPHCNSLLERLVEYIKILAMLLRKKLIIFVGICNYLDSDEILSLYEICSYHKIMVLFLESREQRLHFPAKTYIVDKDNCMIIK